MKAQDYLPFWPLGLLGLVVVVGGILFIRGGRERKAQEAVIRATVADLTSRHDAVDDWEERLSKGESTSRRVLSIELERLWQVGRPLRFVGVIKDVSSVNAETYQVDVDCLSQFDTELRLSLQAPKATIDSFLQKHPKILKSADQTNSIALVAKISKITTTYELGTNGDGVDRVEIRTGHGELLGLVYVGDVSIVRQAKE